MTRITYISFFLLTLISCNEESQSKNNKLSVYKDTVISFNQNNQNIKIGFDSLGNVGYLTTRSDTNTQNIFFSTNGSIIQVQNCRKKDIENTLDFNRNGQLEKINWYNLENGASQYLSFCNSASRSTIIDQNNSIIPVISGYYRKLPIDKINKLKLSGLSIFPSTFEIEDLVYDTTNLEINVSKKDKSELLVKSTKSGTYRIIAVLKSTFHLEKVDFRSEAQGLIYRVDVNLTFK